MKRLAIAGFLLSACVTIRPTSAVAAPGQVLQFVLSAAPVVWSVTGGGTIAPDGTFTAPGCSTSLPVTITITATSGGSTTSTSVTVDDKVTGVTISPATITLAPGQTQKFTATVKTVCFPAGVVQQMQIKRPKDGGPAVASVVPPGV
jgi:plastocyanin